MKKLTLSIASLLLGCLLYAEDQQGGALVDPDTKSKYQSGVPFGEGKASATNVSPVVVGCEALQPPIAVPESVIDRWDRYHNRQRALMREARSEENKTDEQALRAINTGIFGAASLGLTIAGLFRAGIVLSGLTAIYALSAGFLSPQLDKDAVLSDEKWWYRIGGLLALGFLIGSLLNPVLAGAALAFSAVFNLLSAIAHYKRSSEHSKRAKELYQEADAPQAGYRHRKDPLWFNP